MKKTSLFFTSLLLVTGLALASATTFTEDSTVTFFDRDTDVSFNDTFVLTNTSVKGDRFDTEEGVMIVESSEPGQVDVLVEEFNSSAVEGETAFEFLIEADEGDTELVFDGLSNESNYAVLEEGEAFENRTAYRENISFELDVYDSVYEVVKDNTPPNLDLSFDSSVESGESIEVSCSATDEETVVGSQSVEVQDPDGVKYTHYCDTDFSDTETEGEYLVTFEATDAAGNVAEVTQTFESSESSSSSGGSSSGGSTTSSDVVTTNWLGVSGTEFAMSVDDTVQDIEEVDFMSEDAINPQRMEVEEVGSDELPEGTESLENARRFFRISLEGVENEDISEAGITFSVETSWAETHNQVVLSRYDGQWVDLDTEVIDEEGGSITYRASSPGFSYFGIRGVSETESVDDETEDTDGDEETGETDEETREEETVEDPVDDEAPETGLYDLVENNSILFAVLVGLALLFVVGYVLISRRELDQESNEFAQSDIGFNEEGVTEEIEATDEEKKRKSMERLESLVKDIEFEVGSGQTIEDHHAAEKIKEAEEAVENENYDRAFRLLEELEEEIR